MWWLPMRRMPSWRTWPPFRSGRGAWRPVRGGGGQGELHGGELHGQGVCQTPRTNAPAHQAIHHQKPRRLLNPLNSPCPVCLGGALPGAGLLPINGWCRASSGGGAAIGPWVHCLPLLAGGACASRWRLAGTPPLWRWLLPAVIFLLPGCRWHRLPGSRRRANSTCCCLCRNAAAALLLFPAGGQQLPRATAAAGNRHASCSDWGALL